MNNEEFYSWLGDHHEAAYPGVVRWLEEAPPNTKRLWFSELQSVPYDAAVRATRSLYSRMDQPPGYSHHPREIKALAFTPSDTSGEKKKYRFTIDPETGQREHLYDCKHCSDTGLVYCWTWKALRCWREKPEGFRFNCSNHYREGEPAACVHIVLLRCLCSLGSRIAQKTMQWNGRQPVVDWNDLPTSLAACETARAGVEWDAASDDWN